MEAEFGVVMPRRLQVEFSGEVQAYTDTHGGEMSAQNIWDLFSATYLAPTEPLAYVGYQLTDHPHDANGQGIRLTVEAGGQRHTLTGAGNGPIDAAVQALLTIGVDVQVRSFEERSTKSSAHGGDAQACAFMELSSDSTESPDRFGVGLDHNILTASIKALVSGVNRLGLVPKVAVKAMKDVALV
jgi:2-isopropylmalate synthase